VSGIVLDTNVISEPRRKRPEARVKAWFEAQELQRPYLTATVVAELAAGAQGAPDPRQRAAITDWLDELRRQFRDRILPFDEPAALVYGEIVAAARAKGRPPPIGDAQIAAVARHHGLAVATRDAGGFAGLGVEVVDPWTA
jgi:hypothetical protein